MIILTLAWWVTALDKNLDDHKLALAVGDTCWVLDSMISSLKIKSSNLKRVSDMAEDDVQAKKR